MRKNNNAFRFGKTRRLDRTLNPPGNVPVINRMHHAIRHCLIRIFQFDIKHTVINQVDRSDPGIRGIPEILTDRRLKEREKGNENREYKSRLFGFLFGREEHKEWTLSLYNAVNQTAHTNAEDITINTIEDVVYLGMKNDLSLLVSEEVSLYRTMEVYEQQSTANPNMPIRQLMYAGKLYDKYLYRGKMNRYGSRLIPLPIPRLVVFYNGERNQEDEVELRLSEAFKSEIRREILSRSGKEIKKEGRYEA